MSVDIADSPGALGALARALAEESVNIDGFSVERGTVRFLTGQMEGALRVLRAAGYNARTLHVFEIHLENRPGALARLAASLGSAGVQIINTFGVSNGAIGTVYVNVDDVHKAEPVLATMHGARIAA